MMMVPKPKRVEIAAVVADSVLSDDESDVESVQSFGNEAVTAMNMESRLQTALDVNARKHGMRHLEKITIPRVLRFGRFSRPEEQSESNRKKLEPTFIKAPRIDPMQVLNHPWEDDQVLSPFHETYKEDDVKSLDGSLLPKEPQKMGWFNRRSRSNSTDGNSVEDERHERDSICSDMSDKDSCEATEDGSTLAETREGDHARDNLPCKAKPSKTPTEVDNVLDAPRKQELPKAIAKCRTKNPIYSAKSNIRKRWLKFRRGRKPSNCDVEVRTEFPQARSVEVSLNESLVSQDQTNDTCQDNDTLDEQSFSDSPTRDGNQNGQGDDSQEELNEPVGHGNEMVEESMEVVFFNGQTARGLAM